MDKFLQQLEEEITKLKNEQRDVGIKILALEAARNTYAQEKGISMDSPSVSPKDESRGDKIERILKQEGHALHYKEIVKLLQEREGYVFDARDPNSATTATLSMDKRFKRVRKGTYGLVKKNPRDLELFK